MNLGRLILIIFAVSSINFYSCTSPNSKGDSNHTDLNAKEKTTNSNSKETVMDNSEKPFSDANNKSNSIESDIAFIRDKYKIITAASNYKTVPFEIECEGGSIKLERKYNKKNELSYLQYHICGEHGCLVKHHYYWDGALIFIFHKDDYMPGSSHIIEEHRTYFKNGQMIRCLEKKAHYHEGQAPMAELLKKASNVDVDCTPNKLTNNLKEMEALSLDKAEDYFCPDSAVGK